MSKKDSKRERRVITTKQTTRTFNYLMMVARDALERAEADESNSFNDSIVCIVFATFAVEAYVDHTAAALNCPWWKTVERKLSTRDKLSVIEQVLGISIDFGSPPFGEFKWMFDFRDLIAHGKTTTEVVRKKAKLLPGESLPRHSSGLRRDACTANAKKSYDSMRAMIEWLNSKSGVDGDSPFGTLGTIWSEA